MKIKNNFFIIFSFTLCLISSFCSIYIINSINSKTNDVVKINDLCMTVSENWNHSFDATLNVAKKYDEDICILDNDQNVLVKSNSSVSSSINECIKNNDLLLDINVDNKKAGNLIIKNTFNDSLLKTKKVLCIIILTINILVLFTCTMYKLYLNKKIINPFTKLKNFAERIARGNLDIPLEMDKNNIFGAFTESFDIMRDELKKAKHNELKVTPSAESSSIFKELINESDYSKKISNISIPECIIKCDKLRIGQVFDNIISNSYKYASTDITVNSYIKDKFLFIAFLDYGDKVSDDELPLLTEKFYRGKNSKNISGSGIGLYISKYFMNKMEGDLLIDKVDKGFSVTVKVSIY